MNVPTSARRRTLLAACLLATLTTGALAQGPADHWPTKPITLIIPFATGGVSDVIFRALGRELQVALGVPVVVDSKSGAGGTIGAAYVAAAAPDGYTLLQTNPTMTSVAPRLMKRLPYDPVTSFTPIATVVTTPNLLVVNKDLPIHSLADLKAQGKDSLNFATAGPGSTGHLAGQILETAMGIDMIHVPYKSSAAAFPDVIAGRVSMVFDSMPSTIRYIQSGQLRPVAVMSKVRSPLLPDVQTVGEAGYPAATLTFWMGLEGPAGIPQPIVDKLNAAVAKALATKEMQQMLNTVGAEPYVTTSQQYAALRKADWDRLGKLVKEMNLSVD